MAPGHTGGMQGAPVECFLAPSYTSTVNFWEDLAVSSKALETSMKRDPKVSWALGERKERSKDSRTKEVRGMPHGHECCRLDASSTFFPFASSVAVK